MPLLMSAGEKRKRDMSGSVAFISPTSAFRRKMPRLAQPKSKRGCRRCKQRKVKCDEVHPACGACRRHGTTCEYDVTFVVSNPGVGGITRKSSVSSTKSESPANFAVGLSTAQPNSLSPSQQLFRYGGHSPEPVVAESARDRIMELRLMYHYLTNTCSTLLAQHSVDFWRDVTPRMGFDHPHVLDMVLALSALHLSRIHPDNAQWSRLNAEHYNRALVTHRISVQNIGAANANAVFTTTILIGFHSFVALGNKPASLTPYELPLQWLRLSSGLRTLFRACMPYIVTTGEMTGLWDGPQLIDDTSFIKSENRSILDKYARWDLDVFELVESDRQAYDHAICWMGSVYRALQTGDSDQATVRRLTVFPAKVPPRFLEMVEQKFPRALALLGNIFALLSLVASSVWWQQNICEAQVAGIRSMLAPEWHSLLFGPLQEVPGIAGYSWHPPQTHSEEPLSAAEFSGLYTTSLPPG